MANYADDAEASLAALFRAIAAERQARPEASRVAKLLRQDLAKIAKKLGEEAVETVIEGVRGTKKDLAAESADLLYHLLVLWCERGLKPANVWEALASREGKSGIEEKRLRKQA